MTAANGNGHPTRPVVFVTTSEQPHHPRHYHLMAVGLERAGVPARMVAQPDRDPEAECVAITDAVDVIRWYQYQIPVKLARAVSGRAESEEEGVEHMASDADGSAKVALLAIDRSLAGWSILRGALADADDSILDLLVHLDRLRRKTERTFPRARCFVRPGFDG